MSNVTVGADAPPQDFNELLERFTAWAEGEPDVRGLAVFGSRAVPGGIADEWSDLDLILVVREPSRLLEPRWLHEVGTPWVSLVHASPVPGVEVLQVLFEGGFDVDVVPVPPGAVAAIAGDPAMAAVFEQGFRPVIDRDGELAEASAALGNRADVAHDAPPLPDEAEFASTVRDFLFQCAWATKKLRRGELWMAHADCDGYLKELLLRMIAWHAGATGAARGRIRADGRYLEWWAPQHVVDRLPGTFARYDANDLAGALEATMALFRELATATAEAAGFAESVGEADQVSSWVVGTLAGR